MAFQASSPCPTFLSEFESDESTPLFPLGPSLVDLTKEAQGALIARLLLPTDFEVHRTFASLRSLTGRKLRVFIRAQARLRMALATGKLPRAPTVQDPRGSMHNVPAHRKPKGESLEHAHDFEINFFEISMNFERNRLKDVFHFKMTSRFKCLTLSAARIFPASRWYCFGSS